MIKHEDLVINAKLWREISRCARLFQSVGKDRVVRNGDVFRKYKRSCDVKVFNLAAMGLEGTAEEINNLHRHVKELREERSQEATISSLSNALEELNNG